MNVRVALLEAAAPVDGTNAGIGKEWEDAVSARVRGELLEHEEATRSVVRELDGPFDYAEARAMLNEPVPAMPPLGDPATRLNKEANLSEMSKFSQETQRAVGERIASSQLGGGQRVRVGSRTPSDGAYKQRTASGRTDSSISWLTGDSRAPREPLVTAAKSPNMPRSSPKAPLVSSRVRALSKPRTPSPQPATDDRRRAKQAKYARVHVHVGLQAYGKLTVAARHNDRPKRAVQTGMPVDATVEPKRMLADAGVVPDADVSEPPVPPVLNGVPSWPPPAEFISVVCTPQRPAPETSIVQRPPGPSAAPVAGQAQQTALERITPPFPTVSKDAETPLDVAASHLNILGTESPERSADRLCSGDASPVEPAIRYAQTDAVEQLPNENDLLEWLQHHVVAQMLSERQGPDNVPDVSLSAVPPRLIESVTRTVVLEEASQALASSSKVSEPIPTGGITASQMECALAPMLLASLVEAADTYASEGTDALDDSLETTPHMNKPIWSPENELGRAGPVDRAGQQLSFSSTVRNGGLISDDLLPLTARAATDTPSASLARMGTETVESIARSTAPTPAKRQHGHSTSSTPSSLIPVRVNKNEERISEPVPSESIDLLISGALPPLPDTPVRCTQRSSLRASGTITPSSPRSVY